MKKLFFVPWSFTAIAENEIKYEVCDNFSKQLQEVIACNDKAKKLTLLGCRGGVVDNFDDHMKENKGKEWNRPL
jgi:hypothetical protein